ncbi:MAG TPA: amidohydrolase [Peptococcaceae bacterium]|jgi:amidohydrolase|nr:amidohydrolase [Clostridia bacterium]HOB81793.1 amidohydrolase [Peptococcaceae bacterium]HPZ71367.1 amidohydrolase [Peptococcaceae bacterium]HQD53699.1 amidohydrolase [Peptococcaceae bacterium]
MEIKEQIAQLEEELIALRRDFHMHPELGFQEFRTAETIARYLKECGLEVRTNVAQTGVVGLLRGAKPGRTVMLRADMDALPVQEQNDVPYKSVEPGKMHACGHDGHIAMLLVAAKILASRKDELKGNVKFVFQPNEEDAGALKMIEEGVLENPRVDAVFGVHLWSPLPSGKIAVSEGAIMAGQYNFRLVVKGKGGHSGSPHTAIDPIITAANIIQTVQTIQTREIDVLKPTLIIFGKISGGSAPNIIPDKVELLGSMRTLYDSCDDLAERPRRRFERIVASVCEAYQASYELEFMLSSSTLINNRALIGLVKDVAGRIVQPENISSYVCMAGEDFAEFSNEVPGVFTFVGTGNPEKGTAYPHHHPRFDLDEAMLKVGVEMHVRTALAYLAE